jgi:hypothetical protein
MNPVNYIIISIISLLICLAGALITGFDGFYLGLKLLSIGTVFITLAVLGTVLNPYWRPK